MAATPAAAVLPSHSPLTLTVSAASSLQDAMRAIAPLFEAAHPGWRVRLNTGASGALVQQVARGAPVDVIATADAPSMDLAQSRGLLVDTARRDFARNRLVLVLPANAAGPPTLNSLQDLSSPRFARIALASAASAPAGRLAQQALQEAGLWPLLERRIVGAQHVRQVLDYVARGEVDAGFVYATDAQQAMSKVRMALGVPTAQPIVLPIAPLRAAAHPQGAALFVDFVLSPGAQAVLARHGFGVL